MQFKGTIQAMSQKLLDIFSDLSDGDLFGQVDSPESPEKPEITEIIENFIKVTKHLTKLKETLTNYVWEKSNFKKQ